MQIRTVSLNLLPGEFISQQLRRKKFVKVQLLGTMALLIMIFFASLTVALRILQNTNMKQLETRLTDWEGKVSELKGAEVKLVVLKDRLSNINRITSMPSKQVASYNLISSVLPDSVVVSSLSVDSYGTILISLVSPDAASIDHILDSVMKEDGNSPSKIAQISLDSLVRSRDGSYRANLKIKNK